MTILKRGCGGGGSLTGGRRSVGGNRLPDVRDVRSLLCMRLLNGRCRFCGRRRNALGLRCAQTGIRRRHGRRRAVRAERLVTAPMGRRRLDGRRGPRYRPYGRSEAVRRHERQASGSGPECGQRRHADKRPYELSAGPTGSPNLLRGGFGREFIPMPGGASPTNANDQSRRDQLRQVVRGLGAGDAGEARVLGSGQGRAKLRSEYQKRSPLSRSQLNCTALWHERPPSDDTWCLCLWTITHKAPA